MDMQKSWPSGRPPTYQDNIRNKEAVVMALLPTNTFSTKKFKLKAEYRSTIVAFQVEQFWISGNQF